MIIPSLVASLHLLTLALGLGSLFMRGVYLRSLDRDGLKSLLRADSAWGIAALLWIATGLARAFGGLEKGTDFYLHSTMFLIKMGLFALVFALEMKPMITFIKWRVALAKNQNIDTSSVRTLTVINNIQLFLAIIMVFIASMMARGMGGG